MNQHQQVADFTKKAAAAQGRTPSGNRKANATTRTEVTVARNGGFEDQVAEGALRARSPQSIVLDIRSLLERQVQNPVKLLGGRWSTNIARTGNFVLVLASDIPDEVVASFATWLCAPFPGATLQPTDRWTWAQLRGVTTTDANGSVWDGDQILTELRRNPPFENAFMAARPRWQGAPERIASATSTVLIAYVDRTGEISKQADKEGIFMFGSTVKFVRAGDRPTLIQCGRCHQLGHNKSSPICGTTMPTRGNAPREAIFAPPRLASPISAETSGEHGLSTPDAPPPPPPPGNRNARRRAAAKAKQTQAQAEVSPQAQAQEPAQADPQTLGEVGPRAASPSSLQPLPAAGPATAEEAVPPVPPAPVRPRPAPRMVTTATDTARPGESATDRAAQRAREIQAHFVAAAQVQLTPAPVAPTAPSVSRELAAARETLRQLEEDDKRGATMVPSNFGSFNHLWLVHANPAWLRQREVDRTNAQEVVDRASWGEEPREGVEFESPVGCNPTWLQSVVVGFDRFQPGHQATQPAAAACNWYSMIIAKSVTAKSQFPKARVRPRAARATNSHQGPANAVAPTPTAAATAATATATPRQGDVDYRNARATVDSKAATRTNQGGGVNGNSNDNSKTDDDDDQDGDDNDQDGDGDGYDHDYDYVTRRRAIILIVISLV
ncbi:hypothetical protein EDB84DRAFT_1447612 [Lactarius hengduanensis]|nr:hypothetical protein EDB84DRAFT_1447612 [Lactarius hengduanensis]